MNKEDYVSLEVAKLLKEKGFNELCETEVNIYLGIGTYCDYYHVGARNSNLPTNKASYPTLYEAAKWLREVHNIHVMIGVDDLDWWYQLYDCSEDGRMEETNHFSGSVACQKSYEEALNNGIFDALQLI